MSQKVYAKVHKGKILEYPVSTTQIVQRALGFNGYYLVNKAAMPTNVPPYHEVVEKFTINDANKTVDLTYVVKLLSLEALVFRANHPNGVVTSDTSARNIANIDPLLIQAIADATVAETQKRLDNFAKTKNFDDIKSAVTYAGSEIPQFNSEGTRAKQLRDQTWAAMYSYMSGVQTGNVAIPRTVSDIFASHPALTW